MRHVLALDLVDDEELIADYEQAHVRIWPEVRDHLRAQGILGMEIFRLGTRLFMVMEVDPAVYDQATASATAVSNPDVSLWEQIMWTYQVPTPWTPAGEKWVPMKKIFDLAVQ